MRLVTSVVNTVVRIVLGSVTRLVTSVALFLITAYISWLMMTRGKEYVFGWIAGLARSLGINW